MREIISDYSDDGSIKKKILFPDINDIISLKIQFKEDYDTLILFEYSVGTHDINAYYSKISFIKNNQLFVFVEHENPEQFSYSSYTYSEDSELQHQFDSIKEFFIESRHIYFNSKFENKPVSKRNKI